VTSSFTSYGRRMHQSSMFFLFKISIKWRQTSHKTIFFLSQYDLSPHCKELVTSLFVSSCQQCVQCSKTGHSESPFSFTSPRTGLLRDKRNCTHLLLGHQSTVFQKGVNIFATQMLAKCPFTWLKSSTLILLHLFHHSFCS
jgi:hypothetical protein